jgi:hypothetical protein
VSIRRGFRFIQDKFDCIWKIFDYNFKIANQLLCMIQQFLILTFHE